MKVRIYVTPKDITDGCQIRAFACPIARAISRKLKPGHEAGVASSVNFYGPGQHLFRQVPLPDIARRFVSAFDSGVDVSRFNFRLDIPAEVLR